MATRKVTPDQKLVRHRAVAPMTRRARTDAGEPAAADSPGQKLADKPADKPEDRLADKPADKPGDPLAAKPADKSQGASDPSPQVESRAHSETIDMSGRSAFGDPPQMPRTSAPPPLALGGVEEPTHMPGPKDIPGGEPDDVAPAPGKVPRGDSRSFRRGGEFALVYRIDTYVISRIGMVGKRGQWRVIEYPTTLAASNYYARECSRFVSEGFSDYRD